MKIKATKIATIQAKVFRVSTGKWENVGVIYKAKVGLLDKLKKLWQQY